MPVPHVRFSQHLNQGKRGFDLFQGYFDIDGDLPFFDLFGIVFQRVEIVVLDFIFYLLDIDLAKLLGHDFPPSFVPEFFVLPDHLQVLNLLLHEFEIRGGDVVDFKQFDPELLFLLSLSLDLGNFLELPQNLKGLVVLNRRT